MPTGFGIAHGSNTSIQNIVGESKYMSLGLLERRFYNQRGSIK